MKGQAFNTITNIQVRAVPQGQKVTSIASIGASSPFSLQVTLSNNATTTFTASGGMWATGGNWSSSAPGTGDNAILQAGTGANSIDFNPAAAAATVGTLTVDRSGAGSTTNPLTVQCTTASSTLNLNSGLTVQSQTGAVTLGGTNQLHDVSAHESASFCQQHLE